MWTGEEDALEVAHYAANLPRGSLIAEWVGGWGAVTAEDEALQRVEYVLVATNAKRKPKPPKPPVSIRDNEIQEADQAKKRAAKARAMRSMGKVYGG